MRALRTPQLRAVERDAADRAAALAAARAAGSEAAAKFERARALADELSAKVRRFCRCFYLFVFVYRKNISSCFEAEEYARSPTS